MYIYSRLIFKIEVLKLLAYYFDIYLSVYININLSQTQTYYPSLQNEKQKVYYRQNRKHNCFKKSCKQSETIRTSSYSLILT